MKIAIPTREGRVDDHFGHCDHYTIFAIEDGAIVTIGATTFILRAAEQESL